MTTARKIRKLVKVTIPVDADLYELFLQRGTFNLQGLQDITPDQGITDAIQLYFADDVNAILRHYLTAKSNYAVCPSSKHTVGITDETILKEAEKKASKET